MGAGVVAVGGLAWQQESSGTTIIDDLASWSVDVTESTPTCAHQPALQLGISSSRSTKGDVPTHALAVRNATPFSAGTTIRILMGPPSSPPDGSVPQRAGKLRELKR